MRVLAVREVGHLLVGRHQQRREVLLLLDEPAGDRGVVAGGVGERLGGERLARAEREPPVGVDELLQHRVVHLRAGDDGREAVVLRGRADHRRAADVDVLDHLVVGRAALRGGALERVEVHADQVDELDLLLLGGEHVVGVVAQREDARVELRVQRLDAAAHDLGEAGEVLDRAHLQARLLELAGGAAGGDELDAEPGEAARRSRRSRACPRRTAARGGCGPLPAGSSPRNPTRRGHARDCRDRPSRAPRASLPTTAGSSSCSSGRSASAERRRVGSLGHVDRPLGDDRAGVDALVDEVHRDARDLDAVGDGLLDRADAGEGRAAAPGGR